MKWLVRFAGLRFFSPLPKPSCPFERKTDARKFFQKGWRRNNRMWKKGSVLLLALMLFLTGCAGEASLVRDAIVTSLEKPNYEYQGSLKLTGDIDNWPDAPGDTAALLAALKAGVTFSGSQLDLETAKMTLQMNDDKLLRDKGLWTGEEHAAVELLMKDNQVYVKSPLDQKYLLLDASGQAPFAEKDGGPAIDPQKWKEWEEKVNTLMIDFAKSYIAKYGYKLSNAKNFGKETVKLPNGESVEATRVSVTLDLKELAQMFLYTAHDAATNPDVKKWGVELVMLFNSLAEEMDPTTTKKSEAEQRAAAEVLVNLGLKEFKTWLDTEGKQYTPETIVEMAKQAGLEEVKWTLDFHVDDKKMIVHDKGQLSVTFRTPELKQPLTIGLESENYIYNVGKATAFTAPAASDSVSWEQLQKDEKALSAFHEKGFLRALIEAALAEEKAELQ
jgi:hypothetical protein